MSIMSNLTSALWRSPDVAPCAKVRPCWRLSRRYAHPHFILDARIAISDGHIRPTHATRFVWPRNTAPSILCASAPRRDMIALACLMLPPAVALAHDCSVLSYFALRPLDDALVRHCDINILLLLFIYIFCVFPPGFSPPAVRRTPSVSTGKATW